MSEVYNIPQEMTITKDESYPRIEINLDKLSHNTKMALNICRRNKIDLAVVTKVFCSMPDMVKIILEAGVSIIGDSRVENLKRIKGLSCEKLLLRLPSISQAEEVVRYADISLNSEMDTLKALSKAAVKANKVHKIILMIDLGDLREGIWPGEVINTSKEVIGLPNIEFLGIGTNLTCYGGIIPDDNNLGKLVDIKKDIEEKLGIKLKVVSGGNSSSLYKVLNKTMVDGITNLRLGESVVLGRETAYGKDIPGMFKDIFTFKGEIIELKEKPSMPIGNIGMDAFGEIPTFEDKGIMKRAIISVGRQDVRIDGLTPRDKTIEILGGSSDHLLLNLTNCKGNYKVGDVVEFDVDYGALLSLMTSEYINKYIV
ncbi:ornithine racemase Orr [Clostridium culturomicium]|uniref:ornithine racemase Orr n=1 Tax=Clostridium culturomicium TaxID=1499683 RepID=UPI0038575151